MARFPGHGGRCVQCQRLTVQQGHAGGARRPLGLTSRVCVLRMCPEPLPPAPVKQVTAGKAARPGVGGAGRCQVPWEPSQLVLTGEAQIN